jgi:protein-S-isoprenylcysteine O-methyltransferase Ste14
VEQEPEEWLAAAKRRGAVWMLAIGLLLLVAGLVWGISYWQHATNASPITYVRVVTVIVLGIGAGLTIAGSIFLGRLSRSVEELPQAKVVQRDPRD